MISDEWAKGVAKIANHTRTKDYPLLNNPEHYTSEDVKRILLAHQLLQDEWLKGLENENTKT